MDCSRPDSSAHGIFQARTLEGDATSYSRGSSRPKDWTCVLGLLHWQVDSLPPAPPGKCLTFINITYNYEALCTGWKYFLGIIFNIVLIFVHTKSLQSCWTLVAHQAPLSMGILQARILEWVAMSSSRGSSQPRDWTRISRWILLVLPGKTM